MTQYEPEIQHDIGLMPKEYKLKLAKEKLGRHKKPLEQLSVYQSLLNSEPNNAAQLAEYMHRRNVSTGLM